MIKEFFATPYRWASIFSLLLIGAFAFVLLDTFVIQKSLVVVPLESSTITQESAVTQSEPVITDTSYADQNMQITIETRRADDSTIYVADIQIKDIAYLKSAFADNTYGRNIKAKTSEIADRQNAIFAVNGDYYGFRESGYVLRNGVMYRDTGSAAGDDQALVIDDTGNFSIISESQVSMASLSNNNSWQILSFGPGLVENGQITVTDTSKVSQSMTSNPRTAIGQISELHYVVIGMTHSASMAAEIGQISELHYVVIVSDGRTSESKGLSLLEIAQEFKDMGCTTAYNLDGGGSSTMVFNGKIINNPTDGKSMTEREVSDIVYFGY